MKQYDLIVIGGGGGTKISTPAAKLGYKVAIIEKEDLGGTCLNRGCIPSKMLIHPANVLEHLKHIEKYNISHKGTFTTGFSTLIKRVSDTVDAESATISESYKQIDTLDFYHGEATFVSNTVVKVHGEELTAPKIVIATGSRPSIPPIPGLEGTPYMTSREALRRDNQPKKLLIIGGGYIASELGHVYSAFGTETVFFVRDVYLGHEDETISKEFQKSFEKKHKTIYATRDLSVSHENNTFTLTGIDADGNPVTESGDALLMATGVAPNTDGLQLQNTDITMDARGYIQVSDHLETNAPGVYAIGDCVGNYLFRHSVNFEGEYLFEKFYEGQSDEPIYYPPMPHAVFTSPEIAGVGKTEQQLRAEGADYIVATHEYIHSAQGMARLPEEGLVKLMFERHTKKLLGAHIIGEEAATMSHQLILAMTLDATSTDLLRMIYIHPALPEIVRNAVRKAEVELQKE
jgi:dihydrolipoamide dehydrogenase